VPSATSGRHANNDDQRPGTVSETTSAMLATANTGNQPP
jgi:hypothetical protein